MAPTPHEGEAPPPYSETDLYSNSQRTRSNPTASTTHDDDHLSSSNGDIVYTPPLTPQAPLYDNGAALYFETRQPQMPHPESILVYTLKVDQSSVADDFPFQSDWEKREVNGQDWATFINYLLPNHSTRGNDALIERKLRAEAEGQDHSSNRSEASAQLEHLRDNVATSPAESQPPPRAQLEATVQQWNDGFFHPRGIDIQLQTDPGTVPGAWDPSFDQTRNADAHATSATSDAGQSSNSYGLAMDSNGVRLGNSIVADVNGLKIGSLVMDGKGIRFGGKGKERATDDDDRGRALNHGQYVNQRPRSRSASSVSSVSSSSSESSIGSLPDYDDVKGAQLPVYRAMLQDWTASPDTMRSKADVKMMRAKLKEAKHGPAPSDMDKRELKAQIKGLTAQWRHIKKQQKRSRREFKRAKRQLRRAEKRERRHGRREMKRAERDWRRTERDYNRGRGPPPAPYGVSAPPMPHAPPGVSVPSMPPAPHGVCMPSAPYGAPGPSDYSHDSNFPHGPDFPFGAGFPFGGRGRGRGGRGGFGGRGRRGMHFEHQGPLGGRGLISSAINFGIDRYKNRNVPGAWDNEQHGAQPSRSPGPSASAKYLQVEQMRDTIAQQQDNADQLKPGPQRDAIEKSIEDMSKSMARLEMEADQEYAMEVGHDATADGRKRRN